jgi:hypothetical protein
MSVTDQINPPSRRQLFQLMTAAAIVAALIFVAVVLPAEFHRDPTGFGHLTGISRIAGPRQVTEPAQSSAITGSVTRIYPTAFRSDTIDIPLNSGDEPIGNELEYKVNMKAGGSVVYAWSVRGITNQEEFYYDFHGESRTTPEVKVVEYLQATGTFSNGMLIAPMEGVHGWYFQNQSVGPVIVHLKLSGFYELVPPGEYGNEARIEANKSVTVTN